MAGFTLIANSILITLLAAASAYDLRFRRVPNGFTLPLLVIAVVRSFPGDLPLYAFSFLILTAWRMGWMGGGDAKLWIALVWWFTADFAASPYPSLLAITLAGITMTATTLLQRFVTKTPSPSPGAWRTLVYALIAIFTTAWML
ncbi:A24 family peptidase (plasmid) [Thermanaerothrix sp. 4228-RoL]|uniref:A24 family peptidase n=1 Tax=Thermanaerothrix solaris TaxID=3058434 RepID=A0ABU3NRY9_9CHLR|nr:MULTISPECIES: A24 family peptidase [unclassified Thermanaerothrix]MCX7635472.1 A24 family peptidase [Syntrophales bacterium]MDT8899587.1 A24 family peptidase [Thermanaerothrix sp. 4228-RoL]